MLPEVAGAPVVGKSEPTIPAIPDVMYTVSGIDPTVAIPTDFIGNAGSTIECAR